MEKVTECLSALKTPREASTLVEMWPNEIHFNIMMNYLLEAKFVRCVNGMYFLTASGLQELNRGVC